MEHIAAPIAKLSHTSATMSIVCLAVLSIVRSDERRASSARWSQNRGSLMSMERTSLMSMEQRPFSGHIGASAQAYGRSDGKLVIIVRDFEHHLLGPLTDRLLGQRARWV